MALARGAFKVAWFAWQKPLGVCIAINVGFDRVNLVLLGAPGAGKGAQALRLAPLLGVEHISTGEIFRSAIRARTETGILADRYISQGLLVPDRVTNRVVFDRISRLRTGFLLDGYPRTVAQARALNRFLLKTAIVLHAAIWIEVPTHVLSERLAGRRIDPQTGAIYHLEYEPPPANALNRLSQRSDDEASARQQRLAQFAAASGALRSFYEARGLLVSINGTGDPDTVTVRILRALHSHMQFTRPTVSQRE